MKHFFFENFAAGLNFLTNTHTYEMSATHFFPYCHIDRAQHISARVVDVYLKHFHTPLATHDFFSILFYFFGFKEKRKAEKKRYKYCSII